MDVTSILIGFVSAWFAACAIYEFRHGFSLVPSRRGRTPAGDRVLRVMLRCALLGAVVSGWSMLAIHQYAFLVSNRWIPDVFELSTNGVRLLMVAGALLKFLFLICSANAIAMAPSMLAVSYRAVASRLTTASNQSDFSSGP